MSGTSLRERYVWTVTRQLPVDTGPDVARELRVTLDETIEDIVEHAEAGIAVSVPALAANPPALRHRIIRHVVASEFGESLSRAQTLEVARLVTDWHGQGPIDLPGCRAHRAGARIVFAAR